jgi:hypothetical protein
MHLYLKMLNFCLLVAAALVVLLIMTVLMVAEALELAT